MNDNKPARPRLGFFAICLAYCAIILDASVLNVAVPALRDGLGTSMAGAQWVLVAYTLPLAALLLTAGALGDRIGLRRLLLAGIGLFTLASAACAAAPGAGVLIAARAVQGVGAAALLPATLALIPYLFTTPDSRARAAVAWVAAGAVAVAAGPLVGGALIGAFGWRSIFLINLPVGAISIGLAAVSVTETPRRAARMDHVGQVTAVAALGLLTAALILGGATGWGAPATLGALAGAVIAGVVFWYWERRAPYPLVPPSFFADRIRTVAIACAGLMGFAFYGTLFVTSLYFQQLRGASPAAAGLALLPLTAGTAIGPLVLYRPLARRFGHPPLLLAGFALLPGGYRHAGLARAAHPLPGRRDRPAADRRGQYDRVLRADLAAAGQRPGRAVRARLRPAEHHPPVRGPDRGVGAGLGAQSRPWRRPADHRVRHHRPGRAGRHDGRPDRRPPGDPPRARCRLELV